MTAKTKSIAKRVALIVGGAAVLWIVVAFYSESSRERPATIIRRTIYPTHRTGKEHHEILVSEECVFRIISLIYVPSVQTNAEEQPSITILCTYKQGQKLEHNDKTVEIRYSDLSKIIETKGSYSIVGPCLLMMGGNGAETIAMTYELDESALYR